ncbi:hypothetical protein ACQ4M3_35300 [Leptolyngbya sp. AN03gr2]|uniref:hypothetical protein n=1 Tax=unclassified Leptolyngbya TaxID=2650499 RepID=UPI003D31EB2A
MKTLETLPVQANNLTQLVDALTQLSSKSSEFEIWQKHPEITQFEVAETQEYDDSSYFWVTSLESIEFASEADKRRILVAAKILTQSEADALDDQPYDIDDWLFEINDYLEITSHISESGTYNKPKHLKSLQGQLAVAVHQTLADYLQGQEVFLVKEPVVEHNDEYYYSSSETVVGVYHDRRSAQQHLKDLMEEQMDWIKGAAEDITWTDRDLVQQQLDQPGFKQVVKNDAGEFLPSIETLRIGERVS